MSSQLVSMTGHGEASTREESLSISIELRTVNNRYLKTSIRLSDGFASWEPAIEEELKNRIRRGSIQCNAKIERQAAGDSYRLNEAVLTSYRDQLKQAFPDFDDARFQPEMLLALPGVVDYATGTVSDLEEIWPTFQATLDQALQRLEEMRAKEGATMGTDMAGNCKTIGDELEKVAARAHTVVENYQERLTERMNSLLAKHEITIESHDIAREVGLFADRCDISEEIVRLRSHLGQFAEIMAKGVGAGKKLDFVTQEMFREINTIGSKANDAEIARHVIEMKSAAERIREMTQNIE